MSGFVSHPDMPQCVKDRLAREDAEEEAAEEERQRLEYEAAQKQQAEETARLIKDLAAGKLKSSTACREKCFEGIAFRNKYRRNNA